MRCPCCGCTRVLYVCVSMWRLTESCPNNKSKESKGEWLKGVKALVRRYEASIFYRLQAPINRLSDLKAMWTVVPPNEIWVHIWELLDFWWAASALYCHAGVAYLAWKWSDILYTLNQQLQNRIIKPSYDCHNWIAILSRRVFVCSDGFYLWFQIQCIAAETSFIHLIKYLMMNIHAPARNLIPFGGQQALLLTS